MKVHYPKLYNMAHLLALNVLLLPKDLTIIFISYNSGIIVRVVHIQPNDFSGKSVYAATYAKSRRLQFIIAVYVPNEIWSWNTVSMSLKAP